MAAILAVAASDNWNSNGSWVGGVQPTAADDVTIVAGANVTIPTGVTALCRSCTVASTGTLTFATTTSVLTIGDATAGAGNVAFSNAGTITLTGIGTINFISTSATVQTVTTGGQTMPNENYNGTGSWQFADAHTSAGGITHTKGTLDTNSKTVVATGITFQAGTKTLTMGSSSFTFSSSTPVTGVSTTAITVTANTATWNFSNVNANTTINSPGIDFNGLSLVFNGGGIMNSNLSTAACTFKSLTVNGPVSKTGFFQCAVDVILTGSLAVIGNSITNRLLVQASVNSLGTPRTITLGASATAKTNSSNVDLMDITMSGGAANERDFSAITGLSGDCQGNSGITFTTGVTQYFKKGADTNWSTVGNWFLGTNGTGGAGRVPLPQDDTVFDANCALAGTSLLIDMPRMCRNLDASAWGGTSSSTIQNTLGNQTMYGNLTLKAGMSALSGGASSLILAGRGAQTITTAGVTFGNVAAWTVQVSAPGGSYTLQDNYTSTGVLQLNNGTLDLNSKTVSAANFACSNTNTKTLTMGSANITLSLAASVLNVNGLGTTVTANTATITLTANGPSFAYNAAAWDWNGTTLVLAGAASTVVMTGTTTLKMGGLTCAVPGTTLSFTAATAYTIGALTLTGTPNKFLRLPGVANNYASAPDSAALSITGDITLLMSVALDNWTPASASILLAKWGAAGQRSYQFYVDNAGKPTFALSTDGTASNIVTSSVAPTIANGAALWVLASYRASDRRVQFFTAPGSIVNPVASDFTQLGTNQTQGAASIFDSTQIVEIGTNVTGTSNLTTGNFYRAKIYNGVFSTSAFGGTLQFDADFTAKAFGATSFTESSANAATVTINGAFAQAGEGKVNLKSATAGSATTLLTTTTAISYATFIDIANTANNVIQATNNCTDSGNNRGINFGLPYIAQSQSTSQNSATTAAAVFVKNTVSGNTIVVGSYNASRAITSITDSQGNTYQSINIATSPNTELWYAYNIVGGTTPTVTVNFTGAAALNNVGVYELGGVSGGNPLDQKVLAAGSSTAADSGATAATTVNNEIVVGHVGSASGTAPAAGAGYTNAFARSNFCMEAKVVVTTGTQDVAFTTGNAAWNCGAATFKGQAIAKPIATNVVQAVKAAGTY